VIRIGHPWYVNFGDVPKWVAAIGTVGALIAALMQINTERNIAMPKKSKIVQSDG